MVRPQNSHWLRFGLGALLTMVWVVACAGGTRPAADSGGEQPGAVDGEPGDATVGGAVADEAGTAVQQAALAAPDHRDSAIPIDPDDPSWGAPEAPVTVVMFSDFECPFCARVQTTLAQLRETYGPDRLRIVWKDHPLAFHKQATLAHQVGRIVHDLGGNDAFWTYHDAVYENREQLEQEHLLAYAERAGVLQSAVLSAGLLERAQRRIQHDAELAKHLNADGVPAFFINGIRLSGAQPYARFRELIDAELNEAARLLEQGMPSGQVSLRRTAWNTAAGRHQAPEPVSADDDDADTVWKVPVEPDDPTIGPADALVTLVEFGEFQCPFCKRVQPTLDRLLAKYGDQIRIVWKDNPLGFHQRALPAAVLGRFVYGRGGDEAFWRAHRKLFELQPQLSDSEFEQVLRHVGLSPARYATAVGSSAVRQGFEARIEQSVNLAADLKARGTPHFFINGVRLAGAQSFEKFDELVSAELAKARALVADGTSRLKLYETLMQDAQGAEPFERRALPTLAPDAPSRGAAQAPVVIQQFSDLQCPFCARVEPTLVQLLDQYRGQVRIEWRHLPLPFHKQAHLAAQAAHEVYLQRGDAGFFAFTQAIFAQQRQLSRATLLQIAGQQGVDVPRLERALDQGTHQARVDADADAARKANVTGTPGFLVNGYFVSGAQPLSAFKRAVELALKSP